MNIPLKKTVSLMIAVLLVFSSLLFSQDDVPECELPVLTTSAGQSADINTLNVILEQAGVEYDYCDVPTVAMIKDGVGLGGRESGQGFHVKINTDLENFDKGASYKTTMFAIGASLKGMGASGLTVEDEIKRLVSIIEYCQKNDIFIIAVHVGGESKRGAKGSNNEKMIDTVAPQADYIIAVKDSNKDGRFTTISEQNEIPFSEVEYALDIVGLMKKIFTVK
ncbi:MAG: DUF6305 family protein [bacterium]